jgi:hypothetical protein
VLKLEQGFDSPSRKWVMDVLNKESTCNVYLIMGKNQTKIVEMLKQLCGEEVM